jgi:hypothetical protein
LFDFHFAHRRIVKNILLRGESRVVLWTHLGLGDQISAAQIVQSYLTAGTQVIWPVKKKNFNFMCEVYGAVPGIELHVISDSQSDEIAAIRLISKRSRAAVVVAGHSIFQPLRLAFPELSINSMFNLSVGIDSKNLVSPYFRNLLAALEPASVPSVPFAFVDHHPGTSREIPDNVLIGIHKRGLEVVLNPREIPLSRALDYLDKAEELHLVPSAPLCLALTVDAKAKVRIHYDSIGDPVSSVYPRWHSVRNVAFTPSVASKFQRLQVQEFREKVLEAAHKE